MATRVDARQSVSRDTLGQLTNSAGVEVDNILRSINSELTHSLVMRAASTPNRTFTIGPLFISNTETSTRHSISPIGGTVLPANTLTTITFPALSNGALITISGDYILEGAPTLTIPASQFIKASINISATAEVRINFGTAGVSEAAATLPASQAGYSTLGYVVLSADAGQNTQNVSGANIITYVGGGGSGGFAGFDDGLVGTPGAFFVNDTDTGFYRIGTGSVGFSANGALIGSWSSTGAFIFGPAIAANNQGQRHMFSGSIYAANVSSTDVSGSIIWGVNLRTSANNAENARTDTVSGGVGIRIRNRTIDTTAALEIRTNLAGAATTTNSTIRLSMLQDGAFTIGDTSTVTNRHTINGGLNVLSARSTFTANSENFVIGLKYANADVDGIYLGVTSGGAALQFSTFGGTVLSTMSNTGAWVWGNLITGNLNGPVHRVSGSVFSTNATATDGSGTFVIGNNTYTGANAGAGRQNTVTGGMAVAFENRTSNASSGLTIYANQAGDTLTTVGTQILVASQAGGFTVGPSGFTGNHTINGEMTWTGQLRIPSGTAAEPGIVFSVDDDTTGTGMYRSGANIVALSSNGTNTITFSSTAITANAIPFMSSASRNTFGSAAGNAAATTPSTALPNILFYNNSDTNWAGIGTDTGGQMFFINGVGGATPTTNQASPKTKIRISQNTNTVTLGAPSDIGLADFQGHYFVGITNATARTAGYVGELKTGTNIADATAFTTATPLTVSTITLEPGRWMIVGQSASGAAGGAIQQQVFSSISTTTNALDSAAQQTTATVGANQTAVNQVMREVNISVSTTYYLVHRVIFTVGTTSFSSTASYLSATRML